MIRKTVRKQQPKIKTEVELTSAVANWLITQGWAVYLEVQCSVKLGRADIVAIKNGEVWIIESKMGMSLELLDQAIDWQDSGHFVSMAIPEPCRKRKSHRHGAAVKSLCTTHGIGLIYVNKSVAGCRVWQKTLPKLQTHIGAIADIIRDVCHNGLALQTKHNQTWQVEWSPYKRTMQTIKDYLIKNGSTPLVDVIKDCKHHYKTNAGAVQTLKRAILNWEKSEFSLDTSKKPAVLSLRLK